MNKKNFLFVYSSMMIGGSTTSLLSLLNAIEYDKYNVDLLLYDHNGPLMEFIPSQVNVLPPANRCNNRFERVAKMLFSGYLTKSIWDHFKYRKRFGWMSQDLSFAKNATCRRLDKKYDVAVGGLELWPNAYVNEMVEAEVKFSWIHTDYSKTSYIPELEEWSLKKSDYVVCVSDVLTEQFAKLMPLLESKVITLENMLSPIVVNQMSQESIEDDHLFESNDFKIVTVARAAIYQKRLDRAVNVLARLKKEGFKVKWFVIGDGPDKEKLESMADDLGVSESFIMLGARTNPYPYYKKGDIFSLVSDCEGRPMSVTEAQILGLPVVVTRYDSAETQVNDYQNGLIAENDEESIYSKIKELLTNKILFENLVQNCKNQKIDDNYKTYEKFIKLCFNR